MLCHRHMGAFCLHLSGRSLRQPADYLPTYASNQVHETGSEKQMDTVAHRFTSMHLREPGHRSLTPFAVASVTHNKKAKGRFSAAGNTLAFQIGPYCMAHLPKHSRQVLGTFNLVHQQWYRYLNNHPVRRYVHAVDERGRDPTLPVAFPGETPQLADCGMPPSCTAAAPLSAGCIRRHLLQHP